MDDTAPAHVRAQPEWIADLVCTAKKVFPVAITGAVKNALARKGSFTVTAPIWVWRPTSSSELAVANFASLSLYLSIGLSLSLSWCSHLFCVVCF